MADVYELNAKFQRELEDMQSGPVDDMLRAYGQLWKRVEGEIAELTKLIDQANKEGRPSIVPPVGGGVSAEQLGGYSASLDAQRRRLETLQLRIRDEIDRIGRSASIAVQDEQRRIIDAAARHSARLIGESVDENTPGLDFTFTTPNLAPLRNQVGFLADGTPLNSLFMELGPQATQSMTKALIDGMGFGRHPYVVARAMKLALGGNAARARLIARTEMLRSYREANRAAYAANSDIVGSWVWNCARQTRTCAVCWAMHGTEHPLSVPLGSHPNCRCAMVPKTKTYEELGIFGVPESRLETPLGVELFDKLPDAKKLAVLGPGKFKLYQEGEIELPDLVVEIQEPDWGLNRREASIATALAAAKARS